MTLKMKDKSITCKHCGEIFEYTVDNLMYKDMQKDTIITEITRYIGRNVGNYTYEGIANAITEGVWDIVGDTIDIDVLVRKDKKTIVMVTHSEKIVNDMQKRVIQLENGVLIRDEENGVYNIGA